METILDQTFTTTLPAEARRRSKLSQLFGWCDRQEKNRFGWLAVALTAHGCVLTPLTLLAIISTGNAFTFWIMAIAAMGVTLVVNLAALPTKITLPVFFFSIVIDIAIVAMAVTGVQV